MYVIFADIDPSHCSPFSLPLTSHLSFYFTHGEQNNEQWIRGLALTEIIYDLNIVTAVISLGCLE